MKTTAFPETTQKTKPYRDLLATIAAIPRTNAKLQGPLHQHHKP